MMKINCNKQYIPIMLILFIQLRIANKKFNINEISFKMKSAIWQNCDLFQSNLYLNIDSLTKTYWGKLLRCLLDDHQNHELLLSEHYHDLSKSEKTAHLVNVEYILIYPKQYDVSKSVCVYVFVCLLFPKSSETANPNELKYWGMMVLG